MGILDGIVEWIAEQIMYGLDMINTSVLGALGCDMNTFLRYFPAAKTMYSLLVALAIGLILLGWVWNLFKNYGLGLGIEAEDPVRLTAKAILFIVLAYYADEIVNIALTIGGTPYAWISASALHEGLTPTAWSAGTVSNYFFAADTAFRRWTSRQQSKSCYPISQSRPGSLGLLFLVQFCKEVAH